MGIPVPRNFNDLNTLILKVTKACNLACSYCYDWEAGDVAKTLDRRLAHRAVAEAISLCTGKLQIIFHGGEPTLVWSFIEELTLAAEEEARKRAVKLALTGQTNLTRLTDQMVEFSLRHGIERGVSQDGPADRGLRLYR